MYRIRRQLIVGIMALTLAGIASARAAAQSGPTGPSSPSPAGGAPMPQPNRITFTRDSLPKLLKDLGYTVTEKTLANGGLYWQVVTQSENWSFTVNVLPMVHQDKITSILLTSDLGRKISPQTGAQELAKLLQWNQEMGFLVYFGYNAQSGCITAQRPHIFPDSTLEEMRFVFNDYFKAIRDTHAVWNSLSAAPAATPAGNGAPAPNAKPAQPVELKSNIVGTTWTGTENLPGFGKLTFTFHTGGAATMIDAKGQTDGTWTQNGNDVTISFNGCVYQGRITGQTISGSGRITAGAQSGQTWSFQVTVQKN
jgi:hypothetical protein